MTQIRFCLLLPRLSRLLAPLPCLLSFFFFVRVSLLHISSPAWTPAFIMLQSRTRAINALNRTRCFSTTPHTAALSPYRRPAQALTASAAPQDAKRTQSTAAAGTQPQPRSRPSPAFNRDDYDSVQPLKQYRSPAMDHSFVGMTGGQIFHEMMLRQGVKHICTPLFLFSGHHLETVLM